MEAKLEGEELTLRMRENEKSDSHIREHLSEADSIQGANSGLSGH